MACFCIQNIVSYYCLSVVICQLLFVIYNLLNMLGIFDSGVGGLTVVKELQKRIPNLDFVYFGDTARSPYGTKSQDTIFRYAEESVQFLITQGATVIAIACNTVSAIALDYLRKKFKLSFLDVINPIVNTALKSSQHKKIGVIGTSTTIRSKIYNTILTQRDSHATIFEISAPLLVPLVEEGFINRSETRRIIKYYLRPLKLAHIDTLILACTHYPFLTKAIHSIMGKQVKILNPSESLVVENLAFLKTLDQNNDQKFYVSDDPDKFRKTMFQWLRKSAQVQNISAIIKN